MKVRLKAHVLTLPRWFAIPFFSSAVLIGCLLAGGHFSELHLWLALITGLLIMAGGHSFNTFLDYEWTKLDKEGPEGRSVEKRYTVGQSVIATGVLSSREVLFNALGWYFLALGPLIYLAISSSLWILLIGFLGMLVTFWYCWGKFNWTHETALAAGVGPLSVLIGMFAVNPNPPWVIGLIASFPFALVLSYMGLALDEWPDAEANLKKGVKSVAYKVWEYKFDLGVYLLIWILFLLIYHVFLIAVDILAPLTAISFFTVPPLIALCVFIRINYDKVVLPVVGVAALYLVLLTVGQAIGSV